MTPKVQFFFLLLLFFFIFVGYIILVRLPRRRLAARSRIVQQFETNKGRLQTLETSVAEGGTVLSLRQKNGELFSVLPNQLVAIIRENQATCNIYVLDFFGISNTVLPLAFEQAVEDVRHLKQMLLMDTAIINIKAITHLQAVSKGYEIQVAGVPQPLLLYKPKQRQQWEQWLYEHAIIEETLQQ